MSCVCGRDKDNASCWVMSLMPCYHKGLSLEQPSYFGGLHLC